MSDDILDELIAMAEQLPCSCIDAEFEEHRKKRIADIKFYNPSGPSAITISAIYSNECGHCMLLARLRQLKAVQAEKQADVRSCG
jgi:hypothetical protein